jgi:hypothetical protein
VPADSSFVSPLSTASARVDLDGSCLAAARRFDRAQHLPFTIGGEHVGWLRLKDAAELRRWPHIFAIGAAEVALAARLDTPSVRSEALGEAIQALADAGVITGWRNETYGIRNRFDALPLALIERAAARFFGTMTYAVHVNGFIAAENGAVPELWIARRSLAKATDPGMLDSLVGGGIGWGYGVHETLIKECWEESGIPAELAAQATPGRVAYMFAEIPQGTQAEQLFIFDLALPPDFTPTAQDGEVSEHRRAGCEQIMHWIAASEMTLDASVSTLDCLTRRGWLDSSAWNAGLADIFTELAWAGKRMGESQ